MSSSDPNPDSVACPHCGVGIGEACEKPDGELAPAPHARRVKAAGAAAAEKASAIKAPDTIGQAWRGLYKACRLELETAAGWTKLAARQLESMVRDMELAAKAREAAADAPIVEGSTGQKQPNKLFDVAVKLDAQALAIAKALKLTPDTRGTSAPGDDVDDLDGGGEDEDRDELAELDDLARKRRETQSRRRRG